MKNNIRCFIYVIVCVITTICFNTVNAADFEFGKPTRKDNVTTLPLNIDIKEGEKVSSLKIGCGTNNTDVSCSIETAQISGVNILPDSTGYVYSALQIENIEIPEAAYFPVGKNLLANLIITNETSENTTVTIKLKGTTITLVNGEESTTLNETNLNTTVDTLVNKKLPEKVYSSDATLKNVKISQGKMTTEFDKDIFEYVIYDIQDTINSIKFTPECNTENTCTYTISGGKSSSGSTVMLNQGENTVKILVESEDGKEQKNYIFKVYRGETDINSSTLSSLEIKDLKLVPEFAKDTLEYTVIVPNNVTSVKNLITYKTTDENAKATIKNDNKELEVGDNVITISVVNESEDNTSVYKITVKREETVGEITIKKYKDNDVTYVTEDGKEITLTFDEFKSKFPEYAEKITNNEYKFDSNGLLVENEKEKEPVTNKTENTSSKGLKKIILIIVLITVGLAIIIVSGILIFKKKKTPDEKDLNTNSEEENNEQVSEQDNTDEELAKTIDVDEALSDLMNTKQYDFGEDKDE